MVKCCERLVCVNYGYPLNETSLRPAPESRHIGQPMALGDWPIRYCLEVVHVRLHFRAPPSSLQWNRIN
jgi:hypothetical protein